MKIIGWLFSHTILILVVIAVIYGYMFWGNLAGEDTPAGKAIAYLSSEFVEVEEFVAAVKAKQAKLSNNDASGQAVAESEPTESASNEANAENNKRNIEQQPVSISYSHNQVQIKQDSTGVLERQSTAGDTQEAEAKIAAGTESMSIAKSTHAATPASAKVAVTDMAVTEDNSSVMSGDAMTNRAKASNAKETFVSEEIAKQLAKVDERGKVIDSGSQNDALTANWITARKSFYQRNYALSEKSYQQVIDSSEDNYDAYGELGNVYFNQGKNKQAASAYYEAAVIFVKKGRLSRARGLMSLLQRLDKAKAVELQKLIDS